MSDKPMSIGIPMSDDYDSQGYTNGPPDESECPNPYCNNGQIRGAEGVGVCSICAPERMRLRAPSTIPLGEQQQGEGWTKNGQPQETKPKGEG